MSRADLLRVANRLGMWQIVICGPPTPDHVVDLPGRGKHIIPTDANLFIPVSELQRIAPLFGEARLPIFDDHGHPPIPGAFSRFAKGGRVGEFRRSWWDAERLSIIGIFDATPRWQQTFTAGDLRDFYFSVVWDATADLVQLKPPPAPKRQVVEQIIHLYGADLVSFPGLAGRFDLPECEPDQELLDALFFQKSRLLPEVY